MRARTPRNLITTRPCARWRRLQFDCGAAQSYRAMAVAEKLPCSGEEVGGGRRHPLKTPPSRRLLPRIAQPFRDADLKKNKDQRSREE